MSGDHCDRRSGGKPGSIFIEKKVCACQLKLKNIDLAREVVISRNSCTSSRPLSLVTMMASPGWIMLIQDISLTQIDSIYWKRGMYTKMKQLRYRNLHHQYSPIHNVESTDLHSRVYILYIPELNVFFFNPHEIFPLIHPSRAFHAPTLSLIRLPGVHTGTSLENVKDVKAFQLESTISWDMGSV